MILQCQNFASYNCDKDEGPSLRMIIMEIIENNKSYPLTVTLAEVCQETNLGCIVSIAQSCPCIRTRGVNYGGVHIFGHSKRPMSHCIVDIQNILNQN